MTETVAEVDQPTDAPQPPPVPARSWRRLPLVLGIVLAVSAVAVGVLGWQAVGASRAQANQDAALAAARTEIPQVLSFSVSSLDADLARARGLVSGAFANQFNQLTGEVIGPAVKQQGITTKAKVLRTGIVDAQPGRVTVLMYVQQDTSGAGQPAHQAVNQVEATMTEVHGKWLISDMQAL
jgi:Mce-associated membrane protein